MTTCLVDTLAKSMGAGDATKDAGQFLQGFEALREATEDGGLLFVHHTKKDDRRTHPDSSRYYDGVDQAWLLTLEEESNLVNPHRVLECSKNKFDAGDSQR